MRAAIALIVALVTALPAQILAPIIAGGTAAIHGTPPSYGHSCSAVQTSGGGLTTVACTLTTTVGGTIAFVFWSASTTNTMTGIADNCGDSFSVDDTVANGTSETRQGHAYNVAGGSCTVTITLNSSSSSKAIFVHDIAGTLATSDPLDQHAITTRSGSTSICTDCVTSVNVNTAQNNEFVFGACVATTASAFAAGTGWNLRETSTRGITEDQVKLAAGVVFTKCSRTTTTSATPNVHIMTFKSATL